MKVKRDEVAYEQAKDELLTMKKSDPQEYRGSPDLSGRSRNSQITDTRADVVSGWPTARSSRPRDRREEGRLWRRQLERVSKPTK